MTGPIFDDRYYYMTQDFKHVLFTQCTHEIAKLGGFSIPGTSPLVEVVSFILSDTTLVPTNTLIKYRLSKKGL